MKMRALVAVVLLCAASFSAAKMLPPTYSRFSPKPSFLSEQQKFFTMTPANGLTREQHRVLSLPAMDDSEFAKLPPMYAGLLPVKGGNLFYWLFEARENADTAPLQIWINGGPGCSSMDGGLIELGAVRVTSDAKLVVNEFGWNVKTNLLFVDQPAGTGLSVVDNEEGYANNQAEVNQRFYEFLTEFYRLHAGLKKSPLFMAGESYAGTYLPSFATHIVQANKKLAEKDRIPLEAIAMGNPWTDPYTQYASYAEFGHSQGLISHSMKQKLDRAYLKCKKELETDGVSETCGTLMETVITSSGTSKAGFVNMYDVRQYRTDAGANWPDLTAPAAVVLNRKDMREALHVPHRKPWVECDSSVGRHLQGDGQKSVIHLIPPLLESNIRIMVFSGQFDLICNTLGNEMMLRNMNFTGQQEFNHAHKYLWLVNNEVAGYSRSAGGLTYLVFLGGSHMVPMDRGANALDMQLRFVQDLKFEDALLENHADEPVLAGGFLRKIMI